MKHSIIAVGIFSFLIAGQAFAHQERGGTGDSESIGGVSSSSLIVEPLKEITTEAEFSALETIKQPPKQLRKPLDDDYDFVPSSWYESY